MTQTSAIMLLILGIIFLLIAFSGSSEPKYINQREDYYDDEEDYDDDVEGEDNNDDNDDDDNDNESNGYEFYTVPDRYVCSHII